MIAQLLSFWSASRSQRFSIASSEAPVGRLDANGQRGIEQPLRPDRDLVLIGLPQVPVDHLDIPAAVAEPRRASLVPEHVRILNDGVPIEVIGPDGGHPIEDEGRSEDRQRIGEAPCRKRRPSCRPFAQGSHTTPRRGCHWSVSGRATSASLISLAGTPYPTEAQIRGQPAAGLQESWTYVPKVRAGASKVPSPTGTISRSRLPTGKKCS